MKCHARFQGEVIYLAKPGRTTRYKAIPNLPVPADLEMRTCNHCGEQWISPADAKRIDAALEVVYRQELLAKVRAVLPDPKDADRIERDLGLSRGYLSRLRTGRKIPSEPLVAILALIHQQPSVLKKVEAMWERPAA
jgi:hypothetical protein